MEGILTDHKCHVSLFERGLKPSVWALYLMDPIPSLSPAASAPGLSGCGGGEEKKKIDGRESCMGSSIVHADENTMLGFLARLSNLRFLKGQRPREGLISDKKLSERAEKPRFSHVGRRREVLGGVAPQGCFNHLVVALAAEFLFFKLAELKTWSSDERILRHVSCKYGPRVIVRSIRPIRKGEAVCIAYLDLLQPMALRQSELWSKYGFTCCCDRCTAQPPTYVDLCLQETLASLKASCSSLDYGFYGSEVCKELTYRLDQAVEDVAEGNPKACCERLEKMLAESFQYQQLPPDDPCQQYFGARCSTGKTLLSLLGSPTWSSAIMKSVNDLSSLLIWSNSSSEWMPLNNSNQDRDYGHSSHTHKESTISWDRFDAASKGFLNCISRISVKAWPFLIQSLPFLKDIKSPIDFRWLGIKDAQQTAETQFTLSGAAIDLCSQNEEGCQHRLEAKKCIEGEERKSVFQLAAHSLLYGRYLARICYGPDFCFD
ncbi:protein SET DOMAIN GROUP 41 isoform X2 [Cinnamomum micranthum f. kanehirae]|uniref:Protein SET DOMAIN GROUP 41 isoform X2 n=1 Tax=Cinnamomum micranthum f. kanehirae TaxID=337451 RepID=A0A3S3NYS5_9MAGN|nr:protein SET DOMAIN GROUP 41 isoform X2 [Cinnamomum micranthum f. kanehirae]